MKVAFEAMIKGILVRGQISGERDSPKKPKKNNADDRNKKKSLS